MVDSDRGQLLLIAGLLVATTIIGSVILLNSIHADANVNAQQDGKSLEQADRTTQELQTDLEQLFLYQTAVEAAGEPLPYADTTAFERNVTRYSEESRNLSSERSAALVAVEYTDGDEGAIVRQNENEDFPETGTDDLLLDAEELPKVEMNVSSGGFTLNLSNSETVQLTLDNGADTVSLEGDIAQDSGEWECSLDDTREWVTIEFWNGAGEIRDSAGTVCDRQLELPSDSSFTVDFDGTPSAEGTFTVTGTGASVDAVDASPGENPRWGDNDVVVNPEFKIAYDDPGVSYTADVTLYEGEYYDG